MNSFGQITIKHLFAFSPVDIENWNDPILTPPVQAKKRECIFWMPGNRPDPLEESAASITWREMTAHMKERADA